MEPRGHGLLAIIWAHLLSETIIRIIIRNPGSMWAGRKDQRQGRGWSGGRLNPRPCKDPHSGVGRFSAGLPRGRYSSSLLFFDSMWAGRKGQRQGRGWSGGPPRASIPLRAPSLCWRSPFSPSLAHKHTHSLSLSMSPSTHPSASKCQSVRVRRVLCQKSRIRTVAYARFGGPPRASTPLHAPSLFRRSPFSLNPPHSPSRTPSKPKPYSPNRTPGM